MIKEDVEKIEREKKRQGKIGLMSKTIKRFRETILREEERRKVTKTGGGVNS